jgi:Zn-dependent protease
MIYIFQILVLIFSAIIHEYMHGFVAYQLGDDTAKRAGRLTINPIAHLDWLGSVILPLMMVLSGLGFVIGWAKPVPYNPYNLRDKKWGEAKVALAGPLSNLAVALVFGIIYINLLLMIFNLLPIPPLDGSKVVAAFLSPMKKLKYFSLSGYGMIIVVFVVMFFSWVITAPVNFLFKLIAG